MYWELGEMAFGISLLALVNLGCVLFVDGLTVINSSISEGNNKWCNQSAGLENCMTEAITRGYVYQLVDLEESKLPQENVTYNKLQQLGVVVKTLGPHMENEAGKLNYSRWAVLGGKVTPRSTNHTCADSALLIHRRNYTEVILRQFPTDGQFSELIDFPFKWDNETQLQTFPTANLDCTTYNSAEVPSFLKCTNCSAIPEVNNVSLKMARVWRNWHDLWDFKAIRGHESVALEDCEAKSNWRDYHGASFLPGPARESCLQKFHDANTSVLVRGQLSKGLSSDLRNPSTRGSRIKLLQLANKSEAYIFPFRLSGGLRGEALNWEITQLGVSKQSRSCQKKSEVFLLDRVIDEAAAKTLTDAALRKYPRIPARNGSFELDFHKGKSVLLRSGPLLSGKNYSILVTCCNVTCDSVSDFDVDPVLYTQTMIPAENINGTKAITRKENQNFEASIYQIHQNGTCKSLDGIDASSLNETTFNAIMEKIRHDACQFTFNVRLEAPIGLTPIGISSKPQYVWPGTGLLRDPVDEWLNQSYTTRQDYYQAFSFIMSNNSKISAKAISHNLVIDSVDFHTTLSKHPFHAEKCGEQLELYVSEEPQTTLFPYYPYERFNATAIRAVTLGSTVFANLSSAKAPIAAQTNHQFIMLPPKAKFDHDPTTLDCVASDNLQMVPTVVLKSKLYTSQTYTVELSG